MVHLKPEVRMFAFPVPSVRNHTYALRCAPILFNSRQNFILALCMIILLNLRQSKRPGFAGLGHSLSDMDVYRKQHFEITKQLHAFSFKDTFTKDLCLYRMHVKFTKEVQLLSVT